jgi:predicted peptidase
MLAVLALIRAVVPAADDAHDLMQTRQRFERTIKKKLTAKYLLYLPKDYKPRGKQRWPLMLFLHGAGERGTHLNAVAAHGPPKLVKQGREFPFIIVSPQCPNDDTWSNEALLYLLDEVVKKHRVDTNRIYLTGLSMGGYGTWALATAYPERFAAVAPICGGGDTIRVLLAESRRRSALKQLPVWAFHGARDTVVTPDEGERMVEALKRLGNTKVDFTVYPEASHDSWTETYNNPKLYEWFLEHQRH